MSIRTNRFLKETTMLLLLWMIGSVSGYYESFCVNSTALVDFSLGLPTLYSFWAIFEPSLNYYDEAAEWWAGQLDDEPFFGVFIVNINIDIDINRKD